MRLKLKTLLACLLAATLCRGAQAHGAQPPTAGIDTAINDFGFRLLSALAPASERNTIISPLSVSLALAIAYNGAVGETKDAMARTLTLGPLREAELNRGSRELLMTLERADPAVQMEIANALWAQSGFSINPGFIRLSKSFYKATVDHVDFAHDPQRAADTINAWVDRKTHGKIPTIIRSPERTARLVITDAVYFKGRWTSPFDQKATATKPFYLQEGGSVPVPLMAQSGKYPYFETDHFQAIRLPYGNRRFAMYIFLPRGKDGLPALMGSLDGAHWRQWTAKLVERKGSISLPRLRLTYARSLNDALKSMGMAPAFDSTRADLSLIHPPPPPLFIQDVQHKTFIELDEEGTRAAAASSVQMGVTMALTKEPPPFEMVVDHPFFCAIAEQQSGTLLFAGIVTNPARD